MPRRITGPTSHSPRRLRTRSGSRARLLIVVLALPLALSACSLQPLSMSRRLGNNGDNTTVNTGANTKTKTTAKSTAATSTTTPAAAKARSAASSAAQPPYVRGALASGSMVRTVATGGRTLVVNYWTTQPVATWTSDLNVPIKLSAHMETSDTRHAVVVTRFRATLQVDASTDASVLRDDNGRFVMTPPYSYSSTLMMPSQPATARTATISIEFDLLIETVPGSGQYFRQTVLDSFQLTFVPHSQGTSL